MLGVIREASKPLSIERALEACNRILETAVMLKQEFGVESKRFIFNWIGYDWLIILI